MLLEGAECLEIVVSGEQAVLVTACMRIVVLPPHCCNVWVAVNEVDKYCLVCLKFLVLLGRNLKLFAQPCVFLLFQINLVLK